MQESNNKGPDNRHSPLLSVLSKKEWHEEADRAFTEAKLEGKPLTAFFIDINAFKQINDSLGHLEGDKAIEDVKELLEIFVNNLRIRPPSPEEERREDEKATDVISMPDFDEVTPKDIDNPQAGHTGGDEFAILAHTDEAGAKIIKYRLVEALGEFLLTPGREQYRELGVGFAIGSATLTSEMTETSDLLGAADKAMYQDKIEQLAELDEMAQAILDAGYIALRGIGVTPRNFEQYLRKYNLAE